MIPSSLFSADSAGLAFLGAFLGAFAIGIGITYLVRSLANRIGVVDVPDGERRLHPRPVPKAGGIAIYLSALACGAMLWAIGLLGMPNALQTVGFIGGGTAMFLVGLLDDFREMEASTKLILQIAVAGLVFAAGFRITGLPVPGMDPIEFPLWISLLVSGLWIVGITNAFNLIDGSDGVAGGAAVFALSTMAVVFALTGNSMSAVVSLLLAGATLAFLFYNFPPATIFLGDSGSLFLGYSLAALGINSAQKAPTMLAVAIPLVAFGLPVIDTLLVIARRFLRNRPLHVADRGHIHHRLKDLGHSPKSVALMLYGVCGFFSLLALVIVGNSGGPVVPLILVLAGVLLILSIQRLKIPEFEELGRIISRGFRHRQAIASNVPLREAALHLATAENPLDVAVALRYAFQQGEFSRVEIVFDCGFFPALSHDPFVEVVEDGLLWTFRPPSANGHQDGWELRYPIRRDDGEPVGRLSLWGTTEQAHLVTDLELVATEFIPALRGAAIRLGAGEREIGELREAIVEKMVRDFAVNQTPSRSS